MEPRLDEIKRAYSRAAEEFDQARWALGAAAEARNAEQVQPPTVAMLDAYIAEQAIDTIDTAVVSAQSAFLHARAEHERLEALLHALGNEQRSQELKLQLLRQMRDDGAARVAYGGPEIEALFAELSDCWARIRGLRMTFREMHRRLPMPQRLMDRWQLTPQTLDWEADVSQPYALSPAAQAWLPALENLLRDPTTQLPGATAPSPGERAANMPPPADPPSPSPPGNPDAS